LIGFCKFAAKISMQAKGFTIPVKFEHLIYISLSWLNCWEIMENRKRIQLAQKETKERCKG